MLTIPSVNRSLLVHGRTLGEKYPISIATAMIYESELFKASDWNRGLLFVNIKTLIRNLTGSIPGTNSYQNSKPAAILSGLLDDMGGLESITQDLFNGRIRTQFYLPDTRNLNQLLPQADIRVPTTKNQILYSGMELEVLNLFHQQVKSDMYLTVGTTLPKLNENTYLLSHYPHELLSRYSFPKLTLIESHTGKLKSPTEWATKLTNKPDVPFNKFTLQLFGDNNVLLRQKPHALRMMVLAIAQEKHWTPLTTLDKIKMNLQTIEDKHYRDELLQMARV